MLLKTKGIPHLINEPVVGKVARSLHQNGINSFLISEDALPEIYPNQFLAVLTNLDENETLLGMPHVSSIPALDHLMEGDIIVVNPNGVINTLYRINSHQNFLLATERCNSNCLMCSQPPRDKDDVAHHFYVHEKLIPLIPKECPELGITGGEPTLMGDLFFRMLEMIQDALPETEVHCLTNGRTFAWPNVAESLGKLQYERLMLGIPLYSDYYQQHDYIVQAPNAFNQTMQGLYNLALANQRIEIRVVLHKQSIPRLTKLAKFIYKNLPFVEHVAFMGLENQGYTPHNIEKLWIDPYEYMDQLGEAAEYLSFRGLNVSIYNSQLCVMPNKLWKFSRKSISDWKNIYLNECEKCSMIKECGGLFASCENVHSKYLKAFV